MPRTYHVTIKKSARKAEKVIGSNAGKRWRKYNRREQTSKPRRDYYNGDRDDARAAGFPDEWEGAARYDDYYLDEPIDYLDGVGDYYEYKQYEPYKPIDDFLPPIKREIAEDLRVLDESDDTDYDLIDRYAEEPKYVDPDRALNFGGYGQLYGAYFVNTGSGFGFDAVFGEGYRDGNCGFSVKTRP